MLARQWIRRSFRAAANGAYGCNPEGKNAFRTMATTPSDEAIAQAATLQPITDIAKKILSDDDVKRIEPYGRYKAKVPVTMLEQFKKENREDGKLILVTALTPTSSGEGKTCTSVGLVDGMTHIGKNAMVALREPSLGPVFGMKGGAAGGGHAQVVPMDEINLHFTGDMHAITSAHSLLSAMVDNHIKWQKEPVLDTRRISWRRVVDMNDRALRDIAIGFGGVNNGYVRQDGFDITVASEVMAILCLATSMSDLQRRLGDIVVGYTRKQQPVRAKDLNASGAMAALLRDALSPNLVQTIEGTPALVHGGPFANIAHGCSSVIATQMALKLSDYVITEAGFGADLGAEKFFNIKCRKAGLKPAAAVVVATIRALKLHGGVPGKDKKALATENVNAVNAGMPNLLRHIENVQKFGVKTVVAINRFADDTDAEVEAVKAACEQAGSTAITSSHHADGGKGAADLAEAVAALADANDGSNFKPLYENDLSLSDKVRRVATEIYRAKDIALAPAAATKIRRFEKLGFADLPICIAKTQYSFSADPDAICAPAGHILPVADVRLSAGAEFVVALTGSVMTMPGLPKTPSAEAVGVAEDDSDRKSVV